MINQIICAAIKMSDGYIIRGHRHSDCILNASRIEKYKKDYVGQNNQGFIDSNNNFVDRKQAAIIQQIANIKSIRKNDFVGFLTSEDLY